MRALRVFRRGIGQLRAGRLATPERLGAGEAQAFVSGDTGKGRSRSLAHSLVIAGGCALALAGGQDNKDGKQ